MAACYDIGAFDEERHPGTPSRDPTLRVLGALSEVIIVKTKVVRQQVATLYETHIGPTVIESHVIDYIDTARVKWHRPDRKK